MKMKTKSKTKIKMDFRFSFCFLSSFWFLFLLSKSYLHFCWPRGNIDSQLSLDWPRSAIAPKNMAPTQPNLNMLNPMMLFTFFVFDWKYSFGENLDQKYQNYQFEIKFGTYTNSNMQNSIMLFTFFVFDWKYPF